METRHPQQTIWSKCFHPGGSFTEFSKEDVEQSIPSRFGKMVSQYPDRIAIKTASHVLTYTELNATANRLARAILARQGDSAEPVGLLLEKGAQQVAAMLGVLRAGKFFVLLDPSFPEARIAALLEDCLAELVVTNQQNVSLAREVISNRCRLIEFESIDDGICEEFPLRLPPGALAFISYTSGSTGRPKGVIQNHRNILHDTMLRTNAYHICEHDRISVLASNTSNAIKNAFLSLLNGATVLPFDVQKEGVARLAPWLSQEGISISRISSPLFRKFCEALTGKEKFFDMRLILLASETTYKSDVELFKKCFSRDCMLATGLSSSETGIMRDFLIRHETEIPGQEVPVGYPVQGKEILLLDDAGRQIGFNQIGEIAVRSRYVSPGYWRQPALTEAKFKADPDGGENRRYLTGDLGLMLSDGCLVHKGRKDFRLKIRGYGVETAEVEMALAAHVAVGNVIVIGQPQESGEARLVAYFTSLSQPSPTVSDLRKFLKQRLPDYMIPSHFVLLNRIPITAAGKIDRQALPDPGESRPDLDAPFVAPRTAVEKEMAQIWEEVLSLDQVGVQDSFFELGGHSLAAAKVIARIRQRFGLDLPISALFETPTVADVAEAIVRQQDLQAPGT
ncbi:MAG TPA: non-ribosomal peptide synthetase [Candidatus Binatia bacterium]|nr:non-ribosomal peptide synthetase [Candidatus Binatia bacterium]